MGEAIEATVAKARPADQITIAMMRAKKVLLAEALRLWSRTKIPMTIATMLPRQIVRKGTLSNPSPPVLDCVRQHLHTSGKTRDRMFEVTVI